MVPLGVSFSLQIEDHGLVEFDLSAILDPLDLMGLCYALGLSHSFKSCALPPSLLFLALLMSPVWAHNVASTSSGGTTRKQLALGREILYNIQSL